MADYSHFSTENKFWGKPKDWKDEDCGLLPTHTGITKLPSGHPAPFITSFWKFSPEELEEIKRTGGTYVTQITAIPCPMSVSAFDPVPYYLEEAKRGITDMIISVFNKGFNVLSYKFKNNDALQGGAINVNFEYPVIRPVTLANWTLTKAKWDIPYVCKRDGVSEAGTLIGCYVAADAIITSTGTRLTIAFDHAKPEGIES